MLGVGGGGVVLEGLVVRNIISLVGHRDGGRVRTSAAGCSVGILRLKIEAALEEAPADASGVQEVADILSAELHGCAGCRGAHIADRVGITDQREATLTVL